MRRVAGCSSDTLDTRTIMDRLQIPHKGAAITLSARLSGSMLRLPGCVRRVLYHSCRSRSSRPVAEYQDADRESQREVREDVASGRSRATNVGLRGMILPDGERA
jgi:hypothetical protein